VELILIIIIAYLIGNLSPSYLLGKLAKNIDIREHGSGNAGTTNVLRVLGKKFAALTFIVDALKGVLAIVIARYFFGENYAMVAGIFVVIGHNWPVILKFKGGKGVATSLGLILVIHPFYGLLAILVGIITLVKTKIVSLSSMIGMISFAILVLIFSRDFAIFALILATMTIYRHKDNIKRLMRGEEKTISKKNNS
jgi:acyl phosphate:glycerol-3-phosphate acyltransferase